MPRLRKDIVIELSCRGLQSEIRPALARLRGALEPHMGVNAASLIDSVEIALAEVLNNIVEHAGASGHTSAIRIAVRGQPGALSVRVSDDGRPMPGLSLPVGGAPDLDVPVADLPEGGFGWGLIHALTCGLSYTRTGGRNELALCFSCRRAQDAGGAAPQGAPAPKRPH